MVGKRETLRQGKAVELQPGVSGRLNFNDQTLELSNGTVLPISDADKRDLFPANEGARKLAQEKEQIESDIKKSTGGEFFHQLGQSAAIGGIKDWTQRLMLSGDEYLRRKQAESEVSQRISEESPFTSGAATAASFVPDIYLTRGMSALKAAPTLAVASAGSRVIDEPLQVAGEAALSAGGGLLFDKATKFLNKIAARRAASRSMPGQIESAQQQNAAAASKVAESNLQQKQAHNALVERTKNENSALLHQYNLELNDRQNRMIQAKNSYESAKSARESEVFRLKNEYETAKVQRSGEAARLKNEYETAKATAQQEEKMLNEQYSLAQKQYQQALKDMPKLQKEAQKEYSENVLRNVKDIEKGFPKDARIYSSQIGSQDFIRSAIDTTGLAGSKEGAQAKRIITSLFPEGEALSARDLASRYRAIEEAIQRANPEVQQVLGQFKKYLGEKIPAIVEDSVSYSRVMPLLRRYLEKDVINTLSSVKGIDKATIASIKKNASDVLRGIDSNNFVSRLQNGELSRQIVAEMAPLESFIPNITKADLAKISKGATKKSADNWHVAYKALLEKAESQQKAFIDGLTKQLNNKLARYEIKAMQAGRNSSAKIGDTLPSTYGLAKPVEAPLPPRAPEPVPMPQPMAEVPPLAAPQFPPPIAPPQELPLPAKPVMRGEPMAPIPQSFTPQAAPALDPAQGIAERLGDQLEKPLMGKANLNNFAKLGLLKYALGKAAAPIEGAALAGYGGLKALTAPGADSLRQSFKQAGVAAIEAMAQKYPSYNNGILENPQDRRSLTREIEDDPEIPPQQKALLQSKVNRGKRLSERIQ